ncbi:MAG: CIA30 family protein [Bacteroidota bacterium]
MRILICILATMLYTGNNEPLAIQFGAEENGNNWRAVNDGVMGGLSRGMVEMTDGTVKFTGAISLRNNGGFASFRSPYGQFDLSQYETVEVRARTTGQNFALQLYRSRAWWEPYLKHNLELGEDNEWTTVRIPLADFKDTRLAEPTGREMNPDWLGETIQMSFINTGKKEGPFELEVDYIKFY